MAEGKGLLGALGGLGDVGGLIRLLFDPFKKKADAEVAPLTQQLGSSLLPSKNDEAIQIGLDAAVAKIYTPKHIASLTAVRGTLKEFQNKQWREALTKLILTERHERVETSRKTTRVEASQKGPARDDTTSEWARVPLDYEYTAKDPRIMHLKMIAEMAGIPHNPDGVAAAVAYLLSSGYITEKSATEKATEATSNAWEKGVNGVYLFALSVQLGKVYDDIVDCKHMTDEQKVQSLDRATDLRPAEKAAELSALKAQPLLPSWLKILMIAGGITLAVVIIGTTGLWYYKNMGA